MSASSRGDAEDRIDRILTALGAYECRLLGRSVTASVFGRRKTWLISDHYLFPALGHMTGFRAAPIPGLFRKHALSVLGNRVFRRGQNRRLDSIADAIQLKDDGMRLRAFYLGGRGLDKCLKVVASDSPLGRRTRHEIKIRQCLDRLATIAVPRIDSVEEDENYIYVLEEMVRGRRFRRWRDAKCFETEGLDQLAATYRSHGIRREAISCFLRSGLAGEVEDAIGGNEGADHFLEQMNNVLRSELSVPVALCHGDLLPSNLCVSDGKLVFFDWEMAADGVISFDLLRLALKYPHWTRLLDAIGSRLASQFDVSADDFRAQFTAYMALRIADNPGRASKRLAYWRRHIDRYSI